MSYEFAYQSGYDSGHAVAEKKAADRIRDLEAALRKIHGLCQGPPTLYMILKIARIARAILDTPEEQP
jgi:hypothetical protein